MIWRVARFILASAAIAFATAAHAGALRYCDAPTDLDATQQDRLLRFAAVIKSTLEASGAPLAVVARSGLDLSRFDLRYSHAGIALKASANAPWSVRQLYYDCDEQQPRLFDQGMPGYVIGARDPVMAYVSAIVLPAAAANKLQTAAADNAVALRLLAATYSANAYAFGLKYQNCNQWVAEMLAVAWGGLTPQDAGLRASAQQWLREQHYTPTRFDVDNPFLMLAGQAVPWLHGDDHPPQPPGRLIYDVSMPASIAAFVHARLPAAQRLEFCHTERHIVVHRGWEPIAAGCVPSAADEVIPLD